MLTVVHQQIDTPQQRARLADAIVRLRDQRRIGPRQAAYALLDLHSKHPAVAASLLEARSKSAPTAPPASHRRLNYPFIGGSS